MGNKSPQPTVCRSWTSVLQCMRKGETFQLAETLTNLDLKQNDIDDEQFARLVEVLETNTVVTSLNVTSNNLTDTSAEYIDILLRNNKTITSLDLTRNNFTATGGLKIASALINHTCISSFSIASTSIGNSVVDIVDALKHNDALTYLDLGNITTSATNWHSVLRHISSMKALAILKLYDSILDEDSAELISDILSHNSPPLVSLNLFNAGINEISGKEILVGMKNNVMVYDLNISGNKVSNQTMKEIEEIIKGKTAIKYRQSINSNSNLGERSGLYNIIDQFNQTEIVPLINAIQPLIDIVPQIEEYMHKYSITLATTKPHFVLSQDEVASINLYTLEWQNKEKSLYYVLNSFLRDNNTEQLIPFFPYLKLFLLALKRLRPYIGSVWRGVNKNLTELYKKGDVITWWSFNSCTRNTEALKHFLGASSDKTLFNVHCHSGISIGDFSSIKSEQEVLLIPGTSFKVLNNTVIGDVLLIELQEEGSPWNKFSMG